MRTPPSSGLPALRRLAAGGVLLAALTSAAGAQIEPIYRGTLMGGLGGSFLADGKHDPDHSVMQASFGVLTDERTFTVARIGKIDFGNDEVLGGRASAELEYVNIAGELRALSRSYTWGFFVGIGGYRLSGTPVVPVGKSETGIGAALGVEGDFLFTRHFGLAVEFAGHYVWFDEPDLYGFGLVGLAIHF